MLKLNTVQKTNFHGTVKVQLERKRQCFRLQKNDIRSKIGAKPQQQQGMSETI